MMKLFYLLFCLFLIHFSNFIIVKMRATKKTVIQHAKEVEYDNPGLVDFVIRLVNSLLNLPNRQIKFLKGL